MVKIIGINSSLREKSNHATQHDSFTRILLEIGLTHLKKTYKDAETEIIDLGKFNIQPEQGSYSSNENFTQMKFPLANDDMPILYKKIIEADGVIFSSPWRQTRSIAAARPTPRSPCNSRVGMYSCPPFLLGLTFTKGAICHDNPQHIYCL